MKPGARVHLRFQLSYPYPTTEVLWVDSVPDLFGVTQLDVSSLFNKLGVSLQEVDSPTGVFFQVIKLILEHKKSKALCKF